MNVRHIDETIAGTGRAPGLDTAANGAAPADAVTREPEPVEEEAATVGIVLLTPDGERRPRVAGDVPVSELVAELARHYHLDESERWALAHQDGRLVSGDLTLSAAGVRDGQELALIPERAPRRTQPPREQVEERARGRTGGGPVSERTAAMLPASPGPAGRIQAICRAVLPGSGEPPAPAADGPVNPAGLARTPRQPLVRRLRQAGRQASYEHRLERQITAPVLARCVVIAVISGKGGVGKTPLASLLASLFAFLRGDRVIAVDTNPDFGMLGAILAPGQGMCIDELLAGPLAKDDLTSTELDAALARGRDGLLVSPGPVQPDRCEQLSTGDYLRLFEKLREHAGILVLDCGTSFTSKPAKAVLEVADQLVLLADDTMQAAAVAIHAGRWLRPQRYPVTLALNKRDGKGYINLAKLEDSVPDARALAAIPSDGPAVAQLSGSDRFSWRDGQGALGTATRELAALLAGDWPRLELAGTPGQRPR
jgi:MinD-like ATPase involved in chromosome partitioning or flagellar assembly